MSQHLGRFVSEEEAGRAYDTAARSAFGEYAVLNFPEESCATGAEAIHSLIGGPR